MQSTFDIPKAYGVAQLVAELADNVTTTCDDDNYGPPLAPTSAPVDAYFSQQSPNGTFRSGEQVAYAVSYTNAYGESPVGPWSPWKATDDYSLGQLTSVPIDATPYMDSAGMTTGRRIYRMINVPTSDGKFKHTQPRLVGAIDDNTTTTFYDNDFGPPLAPVAAPVISGYSQLAPNGSFVPGNQVAYAVTFTNASGESQLGPWSAWSDTGEYSLGQLAEVPIDPTAYVDSAAATTGRQVFRKINARQADGTFKQCPTERVGGIDDNTTTVFLDNTFGSPMAPVSPPSIGAFSQAAPNGTFVDGDQVAYAVSFVNVYGESELGPWTPFVDTGAYALAQLAGVPTDATACLDADAATIARNVYRTFNLLQSDGSYVATAPLFVGTIADNTSTTWDDDDYGAPLAPTSAPTVLSYSQRAPDGSWVDGNAVSYAVSYFNAFGESALGPWSAWQDPGSYSLAQLGSVPVDATAYATAAGATTGRRVYRMFGTAIRRLGPEAVPGVADGSSGSTSLIVAGTLGGVGGIGLVAAIVIPIAVVIARQNARGPIPPGEAVGGPAANDPAGGAARHDDRLERLANGDGGDYRVVGGLDAYQAGFAGFPAISGPGGDGFRQDIDGLVPGNAWLDAGAGLAHAMITFATTARGDQPAGTNLPTMVAVSYTQPAENPLVPSLFVANGAQWVSGRPPLDDFKRLFASSFNYVTGVLQPTTPLWNPGWNQGGPPVPATGTFDVVTDFNGVLLYSNALTGDLQQLLDRMRPEGRLYIANFGELNILKPGEPANIFQPTPGEPPAQWRAKVEAQYARILEWLGGIDGVGVQVADTSTAIRLVLGEGTFQVPNLTYMTLSNLAAVPPIRYFLWQ